MAHNILTKIVDTRRASLERLGHEQGLTLPKTRKTPLHSFPLGALICEVKRKSPSRGSFSTPANSLHGGNKNAAFSVEALAKTYASAGVQSISVLTEASYFGGSLEDLMRIKNANPQLSVLRKDFLLDEEDVEVSYRAGCDAVLLMASVLSNERLTLLYKKAQALGLSALVEVHNEEEADRVFSCIAPQLVGINCRDLSSFALDKLTPLRVIRHIARKHKHARASYVYESAVFHASDVQFARESGCSTALIGEAAVTHPERISAWKRAAQSEVAKTHSASWFWNGIIDALARAQNAQGKRTPLVKICGLCREEDVRAAVDAGADMLGFVLAASKRQTSPAFIQSVHSKRIIPKHIPSVGVIVGAPTAEDIALVTSGFLDALQIHEDKGATEPIDYNAISVPWYRAVSLKDEARVETAHKSGSPRTLVDAYSPTHAGGSGQTADTDLVARVKQHMPLWLAGGLSPENVASAIALHAPELVDVASGVEDKPGVKSHIKLRAFVTRAKQAI